MDVDHGAYIYIYIPDIDRSDYCNTASSIEFGALAVEQAAGWTCAGSYGVVAAI